MPLVEYICRNTFLVGNADTGESFTEECGHKQDEIRGTQVAGGNDPIICESCGSDKMEPQVGVPGFINMKGKQNLKKGWN